jgi:glycosyltransferase involved in cell wall biosynthesis
MSKIIKYSIVVAVYNRPEEMEELLHSIKNQSFRNFELIIIDDGSQMSSRNVFEKYNKELNISYFFIENKGPALARNFGVDKAIGEWIIFLDSDCTIPQDYFHEVEFFLENNQIDFFGGPDMMDKNFTYLQKSINFSMTSLFTTGGIRGNEKSVDKFLPRSFNMGIKKEAFDDVKGFSDIRQYGEDLDLSYKLFFNGKSSALIPKAKVYHKRRTNLVNFLKQMIKSGKGRRFLDVKYEGVFRLFHLLPSLFFIGIIFGLILFIFDYELSKSIQTLYGIYFFIIFLSSSYINMNPFIGFISVITTLTQFIGYGIGYIIALFEN